MTVLNDGANMASNGGHSARRYYEIEFDDLLLLNLAGEIRLKFFKPGVAPLRLEA